MAQRGPCQSEMEEEVKYRNTELQCVSFPPILSFCLHPSEGSSVPLCPGPEGEQGSSLCFPYPVKGQASCRQRSLCAFGVRCEPRPEEASVFMCHREVYSKGGVP